MDTFWCQFGIHCCCIHPWIYLYNFIFEFLEFYEVLDVLCLVLFCLNVRLMLRENGDILISIRCSLILHLPMNFLTIKWLCCFFLLLFYKFLDFYMFMLCYLFIFFKLLFPMYQKIEYKKSICIYGVEEMNF